MALSAIWHWAPSCARLLALTHTGWASDQARPVAQHLTLDDSPLLSEPLKWA